MSRRGSALALVLMLMLFLSPILLLNMKRGDIANRLSLRDRNLKAAQGLAANVVLDYMRQFSQDPYARWEGSAVYDRPEAFYSVGFSTVTFIPRHDSLYLRALGKLGSSASSPVAAKTLEATLSFYSDLTRFSTIILSTVTTFHVGNASMYGGGFYVDGNYQNTGANVRFDGGPLIVKGWLHLSDALVNGDIYVGGAYTVGTTTVTGNVYPFTPSVAFPDVDPSFYLDNSNFKRSGANERWQFDVDGATGKGYLEVVGSVPLVRYFFPEVNGIQTAIVAMEDGSLIITGTVKGRVTLVCSGSGAQGIVIVEDNLVYSNGLHHADANHALAVYAMNNMEFRLSASPPLIQYFDGMALASMPDPYFLAVQSFPPVPLRITGLRMRTISTGRPQWMGGGYVVDPYLIQFPPPGLPEKVALSSFRQKP